MVLLLCGDGEERGLLDILEGVRIRIIRMGELEVGGRNPTLSTIPLRSTFWRDSKLFRVTRKPMPWGKGKVLETARRHLIRTNMKNPIPKSTAYKIFRIFDGKLVFAGSAKDARRELKELGGSKAGYQLWLTQSKTMPDLYSNPTLSFPLSYNSYLGHILDAESSLRKAGVIFDTGFGGGYRDWELDWSLKGAILRNPIRHTSKGWWVVLRR